ncbi:N-acetylglucosamine-1-phosphate uridyltransferase [Acetivibrio straminisolvens JCM 21531]|uniref:N-acetylglucosamine-1-phosphate uridyltransferase n=1 Tax=Acetivibrio straminisolvens JCM 21531 TaxID=1294263 RepID=W4V1Z4_9FIRM|nr:N-acetylglucosamine-1-phosphate uridyltransferase [Acetivibrio straminisolvens JCM 21531]
MGCLMAVILAAGEGKRMKSKKAKVVHEILGMPLVEWVYRSVKKAGIDEVVLVVGHKAEEVKEKMGTKPLRFSRKAIGNGACTYAGSGVSEQ